MKVAFIVNQFPAISQTFVLRQITGLLDRGHEVDIFAYSPGTDSVTHRDIEKYGLLKRTVYLSACASSQFRIVRLIKRTGLVATNLHKNPMAVLKSLNPLKFGKGAILLQVLNQIVPFLDKGPYDIVHCQFGYLGELGLLLRDTGVLGGKIVTSFRGYDISSYVRSRGDDIYDDLFKRADLFLCVSERIKRKLVKFGCKERKIIVHRSGVDTRKDASLPRLPKDNGKVKILTVARLVEKKGVKYGIQAVSKVVKKYPHVEYKIAGDGPLRDRLKSLIEQLKVGDNIKLVGWRSQHEIAELLEKSDMLLTPSVTTEDGDEEGIPGVIMEAFAKALPVVGTDHAGIPEVVQDGESGFLVPERDVDGLAEKLQSLVEQPALRSAMGLKGRNFIDEYYNIEKLNDRLVYLYQKLLHGEIPNMSAKLCISPELPPA